MTKDFSKKSFNNKKKILLKKQLYHGKQIYILDNKFH